VCRRGLRILVDTSFITPVLGFKTDYAINHFLVFMDLRAFRGFGYQLKDFVLLCLKLGILLLVVEQP